MEDKLSMLDLAITLWDEGTLLVGEMGKGSLYKYKDEYYIINYTPDYLLESIEMIYEKRAKKLIKESKS